MIKQKERLLLWDGKTICLPDLPAELKVRPYYIPFPEPAKRMRSTLFDWLKKVLEVIPEYKVNKLHELLPQNLEL